VLEKLLDMLRSIPAPVAIAVAFVLPAAETALMAGLLIPGELIVVAAGLLAARGHVPVIAVAVAAVCGAIVGDSVGFLVGRHYRTVITKKLHAKRWNKAQEWLKRRGKPAIFLARFTAFVRSVMPAAAGTAKIPYGTFLLWSVPAGIVWGVGSVLLGYYAGRSSEAVLRWVGIAALALIAAFVGSWWLTRKKRRRHRARPARASSSR
jgi:membrane-associated protein